MAALTEKQQDALSDQRALRAQDTKMPFLIHRVDGRLMPNTPRMRLHKDYRPYSGSVKASLEERMLFLATGSTRPRLVNSEPEPDEVQPFDVGKATKDQIIEFAFTELNATLDPGSDIRTLRRQLLALADAKTGPKADSLS